MDEELEELEELEYNPDLDDNHVHVPPVEVVEEEE